MFPIPWNFPFRKKNGDLSTIGDMIGGGGGSDLPPHSASDAGKLLGVKNDGSLEWSDEVNSEIQTLTNNVNLLDDRVDEKGVIYNVETTADGVKTYAEIFKDIFDDVIAYLTAKDTGMALLTSAYIGGVNISAGSQGAITKDVSSFIITGVGLSGSTKLFQLYFHTSNANGQYTEIDNSTSAITYKNFSNDVPAQNTYFRVGLLYFSA